MARKRCVCHPSSSRLAQHGREAAEVGEVTHVEGERSLVEITEQVERLHADVGAWSPRLRSAQKFSTPLVVDPTFDGLLGVVDWYSELWLQGCRWHSSATRQPHIPPGIAQDRPGLVGTDMSNC